MSEISDLFNKPPLTWTPADLELAKAYYKEHRGHFDLINKAEAKAEQIELEELIKEMSP
jgi:hypothetical protein